MSDLSSVLSVTDVFGPSPFVASPTITTPFGTSGLDNIYFATQQTANIVSSFFPGSTVVQSYPIAITGTVSQNQPTLMVMLPTGISMNAGLVANFFSHGYNLGVIQGMLQTEVANVTKELTGTVIDSSTIIVNLPAGPPPPPPPIVVPCGFGLPIPLGATDGLAYNMTLPSPAVNGMKNTQIGEASPNGQTYIASVWQNPLLGSTIGRWTLVS